MASNANNTEESLKKIAFSKSLIPCPFPENIEKGKIVIKQLFNIFDPKGEIRIGMGYYYLISKQFLLIRKIKSEDHNLLNGKNFDEILMKITNELENLSDKSRKLQILSLAATEYKIHLMPKSDYILPVIEKILLAFKSDPDFLALIHVIKVTALPGKKNNLGQIMPQIVIYPSLGKQTTEKVIQRFLAIFSDTNLREISCDVVPRYSKRINDLIYYTQGSGDLKNKLLPEDQAEFLSPSLVHFNEKIVGVEQPSIVLNTTADDLKKVSENAKSTLDTAQSKTKIDKGSSAATTSSGTKDNTEKTSNEKINQEKLKDDKTSAEQTISPKLSDINNNKEKSTIEKAVLLERLKVVVWKAVQDNLRFKEITIEPETPQYTRHLRLWIEPEMRESFEVSVLFKLCKKNKIPARSRTNKRGVCIMLDLPDNTDSLKEEDFPKKFLQEYLMMQIELRATPPLEDCVEEKDSRFKPY